ncbi:MAG: carotenoid oxygenase family protein [Legionellaceae bacterium]|nr:carotenoid oxygenase family protein [Legionellaceae bacterium]
MAFIFDSQYQELNLDAPQIEGTIPPWLLGTFVSNGPAQFEVGDFQFKHWFDGFAMLKKFEFRAGRVRFQSQFLRSLQYTHAKRTGRLHTSEFATYKDTFFPKRLMSGFMHAIKGVLYDNCNVNTALLSDTHVALTESQHMSTFALDTLETLEPFRFDDAMKGQLTTAHPYVDSVTGDVINVAIEIGRTIAYHVYQISPHKKARTLINTYRCERLFYMHSFCVTPNYIILLKNPLVVHPMKLLFDVPFNLSLNTLKNQLTSFILIHRKKGHITEIPAGFPFVCLHSVSAYELRDTVFLDLVCHPAHNPYDLLYLDNLRAAHPVLPSGELVRFELAPKTAHCTHEVLSATRQEFPRINAHAHAKYQFVYTSTIQDKTARFFDSIQKFDLHTRESYQFKKPHYLMGEALFVAAPRTTQEDEGVLLCIAYNAATQCSSLLVIDARDMQQLAEVCLPMHLPMGLHGQLYRL